MRTSTLLAVIAAVLLLACAAPVFGQSSSSSSSAMESSSSSAASVSSSTGSSSSAIQSSSSAAASGNYSTSTGPSSSSSTASNTPSGNTGTVYATFTFPGDFSSLNSTQVAYYVYEVPQEVGSILGIAPSNVAIDYFGSGSIVMKTTISNAPNGALQTLQDSKTSGLLSNAQVTETSNSASTVSFGFAAIAAVFVALML